MWKIIGMIPHLLTIAGSDPSGGAGIQGDLKTFSALGCYGMAAITALTAQNTQGVQGVFPVPPDFVALQIQSIFSDIRVDALKTGMLADARIIEAVAGALAGRNIPFVLDPVMISTSGHKLLEDEAVNILKERLFPLAVLITPNLPEAEALLGRPVNDPEKAARDLLDTGARAVLLKGGHGQGEIVMDILVTAEKIYKFETKRIDTKNTHGTGCALAAAIAAFLGRGYTLPEAVGEAHAYLAGAIAGANVLKVGKGHGPVDHFHGLRD